MAFNVSITPIITTGYISVSNNFFSGTITDVVYNGVSLSFGGASFPLPTGSSTSGTAIASINGVLVVYYENPYPPPQHIEVTDSQYNYYCNYATGGGQTFTATLDVSGTITILGADGACP